MMMSGFTILARDDVLLTHMMNVGNWGRCILDVFQHTYHWSSLIYTHRSSQSKTLHTWALCRQCLNVNPEFGVAAQRSDTISLCLLAGKFKSIIIIILRVWLLLLLHILVLHLFHDVLEMLLDAGSEILCVECTFICANADHSRPVQHVLQPGAVMRTPRQACIRNTNVHAGSCTQT